ncbi:MAG TPA: HAD family hydrolase [Dehalococcoidia bacterium]|nr:HAD family hydrolase [Dehalococcoidia bacterium]
MPPDAILFDLDETLTDRKRSFPRYVEHLQRDFGERLLAAAATELVAAVTEADGDGYRSRDELAVALRAALPWRSAPSAAELIEHWLAWFPRATVARAGMEEMLQALRAAGIRLGVVTNGGAANQRAKVEALGLDRYVDSIIISGEAGIEKPDPRIFALALAALDCEPSRAWFIGDHPRNDVLGAAGAGLRAIWLRGVRPWPAGIAPPAHSVSSLRELCALAVPAPHATPAC